jgi:hypothetical protein
MVPFSHHEPLDGNSEGKKSGHVRKSPWVLIIFVLIGGLLGGILGEILHVMAPQGTIQSIFATNFSPGINPPLTIDLVLIKLVLGFNIKVNILSILGMFIGIYLYKHV